MFSQFKGHLRRIGAQIAPRRFIDETLAVVTPEHAHAHFRHCGYPCAGGESSDEDEEDALIALLAVELISYQN